MLEKLKEEVCAANLELVKRGLVISTWGNVSGRDPETGLMVIKPSGVAYSEMLPRDLPVVAPDGHTVEGSLRPSSDTPTHLALYSAFPGIGGITHTHSPLAVAFAQAGRPIPAYGTTHADCFPGPVPCTRRMTPEEIAGDYEYNTGLVIAETVREPGADMMRAVLVHSHGPFTWGPDAMASVDVAEILEAVAGMAINTEILMTAGEMPQMQRELLERHFYRKHGKNAYYGQSDG